MIEVEVREESRMSRLRQMSVEIMKSLPEDEVEAATVLAMVAASFFQSSGIGASQFMRVVDKMLDKLGPVVTHAAGCDCDDPSMTMDLGYDYVMVSFGGQDGFLGSVVVKARTFQEAVNRASALGLTPPRSTAQAQAIPTTVPPPPGVLDVLVTDQDVIVRMHETWSEMSRAAHRS